MSAYAELAVTTNFSFLRGASTAEELVEARQGAGPRRLGIADRNTVAGVVRAHAHGEGASASRSRSARGLVFTDGTPDILAYPGDRAAWGRLTRLLSVGKGRAEKGDCISGFRIFWRRRKVSISSSCRRDGSTPTRWSACFDRLKEASSRRSVWLAASMLYRGDDRRRLADSSRTWPTPRCSADRRQRVLYHAPERRALQDVVTCIREHLTLEEAGTLLEANAERHLKSAEEMARLFARHPEAIGQTTRFLERCKFSLDELEAAISRRNPHGYATPQDALVALTKKGQAPLSERRSCDRSGMRWKGAWRHRRAELRRYFLTVHDIVRYARVERHPLSGPRLGGQFGDLLLPRHHRCRPERAELLFERLCRWSAASRPTSTSISSTSGAKRSSSTSIRNIVASTPALAATVISLSRPQRHPRSRQGLRPVQGLIDVLAASVWGWSMDGVSEERRAAPASIRPIRDSSRCSRWPKS